MNRFGWMISGLALLGVGCEAPPDNLKLLDEFVVSTNYDPEADFGSYATYAMPTDTIGFASNTSNDTILVQGGSNGVDFPRPVLESIRTNMAARGFGRVDNSENPDLGINVTLINDYNVFQQVVYPNGYYSGYYGYSSYYYYPYVNTVESNTGVLIVEILDLKNRTPDNKVKVVWTSYIGDIYSGLKIVPQAKDAIDQSFIQSPYLEN